jgi:hypothetical protein
MKIRLLRETIALNYRHRHYAQDKVLEPFAEPVAIVERAYKQKAAIDADRNLTNAGKDAARAAARKAALEDLAKWHTPRLSGLDADLGVQRSALVPASTEKVDDRKIDFLLSRLRDRTPEEVAMFYNSASDGERQVMEAAAASVGRVPMKVGNGQEWKPLLDPEIVNETVLARVAAKNPEGVAKLQELAEIRAMHVTFAGNAAAEVEEVLAGYNSSS